MDNISLRGNLHGAAYLLALTEEEKDRLPEAISPLANRYFTRIDFARINVSPSVEGRIRFQRPDKIALLN